MIAINLKPYEGLKQAFVQFGVVKVHIAIHLKPYEGLKQMIHRIF